MYAHTAAHQQAMSSVVVKERKKKTEKKFTRNNQIVGSSRTAAARGVKKLLYLQALSIQPTFFLFRPPQKDFAYLESAKLVERKGRVRPFSYKYSSRIPLPSISF